MRARKALAIALSLPFLVFFVMFDIVKMPFVVFAFFPLWGLMDLIGVLRGEKSMLCKMLLSISFMGIAMWADMVGLKLPRWMNGF